MKLIFSLGVVFALLCLADSKYNPPKVKVYSLVPGQDDMSNTLICFVTDFHPPNINIRLLKNGEEIESDHSDLAFSKSWQFHLSYSAQITPSSGDTYSCQVTHNQRINNFEWDPKM